MSSANTDDPASESEKRFSVDYVTQFGASILAAAGATEDEARIVMAELVAADLAGHPSHGVMRLLQYVGHMGMGDIRPGISLKVVRESPVVSVYDGHFGFGQCIMRELLAVASTRAREQGTYTAFCRNCGHIGRLGSYTRDAARDGLLAMMMVNVSGACRVAPFGSIDARLGTNPISIAAPRGDDVICVDTTTCSTAEGKVRIAHQNGEPVPEGMIIDNQGRPTTDPNNFYTDPPGAILPLGGPIGFKGSGLAVMIDVVAGILSGTGFGQFDVAVGTNGVWLYLVDLDRVVDRDHYESEVERYVAYLKDVRVVPGVEEVLMPGEPERLHAAHAEGVRIPCGTWAQLLQLAKEVEVSVKERKPSHGH
jgi:uncharacterized oxidoreductase